MKRTLAGAALFLFLAQPAHAITVWQGDMFVTSISETVAGKCAAVNLQVGDFARGIFRPKGLPTNGTSDLLSLVFGRSAIQLAPTTPAGGSLNAATKATVRVIYGSAGYLQFTGNDLSPTTTVNPPTLTTSTPTVAITIKIANIFSSAVATPSGCTPTFTGTLAKRP